MSFSYTCFFLHIRLGSHEAYFFQFYTTLTNVHISIKKSHVKRALTFRHHGTDYRLFHNVWKLALVYIFTFRLYLHLSDNRRWFPLGKKKSLEWERYFIQWNIFFNPVEMTRSSGYEIVSAFYYLHWLFFRQWKTVLLFSTRADFFATCSKLAVWRFCIVLMLLLLTLNRPSWKDIQPFNCWTIVRQLNLMTSL